MPLPLPLPLPFLFLPFLSFLSPTQSNSKLNPNYYQNSCPQLLNIVEDVITYKQISAPATAAATLRLFFHDCMVEGCDASILIASSAFKKAERDADINLSLPGDAFDVITRVKAEVELQCPGIVSCADIIAVATRDLISLVGGPYYQVALGRKDGLISNATRVEPNLIRPNMSLSKIIFTFAARGFSVQEMVALVGAHTIGFSHCKEFTNRIFNFSKTSPYDPSYYPKYAEKLRKLCANYTTDPDMAAFNDVMTPQKFDNMYYKNLQRGFGLLASDHSMAKDSRTKPFVDLYAGNETAFFEAFSRAMEKVSVYKITTGRNGEVRQMCDKFNSIET